MKPRLVNTLLVVSFSVLVLSGCASSSWNPLKLIYGRQAAKVDKLEAREAVKAAGVDDGAVVETYKVQKALQRAAQDHPGSRSVQLAVRFNGNALSLLQQVHPLSLQAQQVADSLVEALHSADKVAREKAEFNQGSVERELGRVSQELQDTRAKLKDATDKAQAEAAKNLERANEARWSTLVQYGGYAISGLLGLLTIAYRLNIGRLQQGAAEVLSQLQQTHGDEAAATARGALDAVLHTGEQRGVAKYVFALTKK